MKFSNIIVTFCTLILYCATASADPLPSWNDGAIKKNIIQFVQAVSDKSNPDYVPPADRIATIDNDGTLWVEQPLYTQFIFSITRFKELAATHPQWKQDPKMSALLKKNPQDYSKEDMLQIFAIANSNITVDDFMRVAKQWLETAENPRFKHRYTDLVYQPMLEVLQYLRANGFTIYIVSGGGQEFIRVFSQQTYDVPVERVIGTAGVVQYAYNNGKPALMKLPKLLFLNDKSGKPEAINLIIGKKPIIAFGNSDGDREMLEWTQSNKGKHLMLLVHHDDAEREYAYDTQSKVGTFSTSLFTEADKNHWQVISMKKDWKVIFPFNLPLSPAGN